MGVFSRRLSIAIKAVVAVISCLAALLLSLKYVETFGKNLTETGKFITTFSALFLSLLFAVIAVVSLPENMGGIYRAAMSLIFLFDVSASLFYFAKISGIIDKFDSIEELRTFVSGYGKYAVPAFILLQFAEATVLPVPGIFVIGAGVALFGEIRGAIYSYIGIISASYFSFFIGRKLGKKAVGKVVGEKNLEKWLSLIKGKDKALLSFMFLFPFFPDDVLCFVSGLTNMSFRFYAVMIAVTRAASVVFTAFSVGGKTLPLNTVWGGISWALFFVFTAILSVTIYKKGDRIEEFFKRLKKKRR